MDEDGWVPPTEAELKVLQAKRERSDKVSQLMGRYLLQGYKMLDQYCPRCSSILMQAKNAPPDQLHCVSCIDLDSEISKDDPALSNAAALATVSEGRHRESESHEEPAEHSQPSGINRGDLERSPVTAVHDIPGHRDPLHTPDPPRIGHNTAPSLEADAASESLPATLRITLAILERKLSHYNELMRLDSNSVDTLNDVKLICDCINSACLALKSSSR